MKSLVLAATVLASLSASAQVRDEQDRFEGKRKLGYTSVERVELRVPRFDFVTLFDEAGNAEAVSFMVTIGNSSTRDRASAWQYLSCHSLRWLVDGSPISLPDPIHRGRVIRGGVIETLLVRVPIDEARRLATAQMVEYRICNDQFAMPASAISGLREMLGKLDT